MFSLMKKVTWLLFLISIISSSFAQKTEQLRIAILDFTNTGGLSKQETITLGNRLRSMLVKTDAFIVLERGQMDDILEEQGFQQTGCTTTECAVEMGALLNVEKMISGSIGKLGKTYTIDLSLIDVKTARIEKSFFRDFKGEIDGLLDLMEVIANQIAAVAGGAIPVSPDVEMARMEITSDPDGAKVFINDREVGLTPYTISVKKGGKVVVRIEKNNYMAWEKTISVDSDAEIEAELEYTESYKKVADEEGGVSTWVWIGGGALVVGGAAVLLMSGSSDDPGGGTETTGFPAPPDRP
jgi:hypothetical protein